MVLGLTFKSLIHFEFIFIDSVRKGSRFYFFAHSCPSCQYHLLKQCIPIAHSCFLCCTLIDHMNMGLFLGSLFCSIDLCVCFMPVPYYLDYCSFVVQFQVWDHDTSSFVFLFCFGYSESFVVSQEFQDYLFQSVRNAIGVLIRIVFNLQIDLGSMDILIILILGFPGGAVVESLPANAGDTGSEPWSGKIPHAAERLGP